MLDRIKTRLAAIGAPRLTRITCRVYEQELRWLLDLANDVRTAHEQLGYKLVGMILVCGSR